MDIYKSAFDTLDRVREKTDSAIVALSGGKESLCVLDMAHKVFPKVAAVHFEFVPGLRVIEDTLDWCRQRYGVPISYYPHPGAVKAIICSVYRNTGPKWDNVDGIAFGQLYETVKRDFNNEHILTGARRADSRQRRILMDRGLFPGIHPLADWAKAHVFAYLKRNGIPIPPQMKGRTTNISLAIEDLIWLHENYPDDFERLCRVFPFARAAIFRHKNYGYG